MTLDLRVEKPQKQRMLTAEFASHFAEEWIAAWNARDLPRVLAHYTEDFEMASPRIVDIAGEPSGVLKGKANVAAYWEKALSKTPDLHFDRILTLIGAQSIAIHYKNQIGGFVVEVCDIGPDGLVTRAAAHYA